MIVLKKKIIIIETIGSLTSVGHYRSNNDLSLLLNKKKIEINLFIKIIKMALRNNNSKKEKSNNDYD